MGRDGVLRVYNVSEPMLIPFLSNSSTDGTAVVIAPGGGYSLLSIEKEGYDVARAFNEKGIHAFVLKYRVPARPSDPSLPKWWAPLEDATRAVGYLRYHAKTYNLNASALGFVGFSAGGHLTAHISTLDSFESRLYPHVDEADSVSCRPDFSIMVYPWYLIANNTMTSQTLSPELQSISTQTPPACLFHASDDPTAPFTNSAVYFSTLHGARNKHDNDHSRLEINGYGGHGFGLCSQFPDRTVQICSWLDRASIWMHRLVSGEN